MAAGQVSCVSPSPADRRQPRAQIRLGVPAGFTVMPAGPLTYDLPSLGHYAIDLTVTAPPAPGPVAGS